MKPTRHAIAMAAAMLAASAATAQQQPKEPQTQEEGMKVAPPRMVFSGSKGGRRSGLRKPTRRR